MDFNPSWRRPHRDNDIVPPSSSSSSSSDVTSWWRRHPCLVCGKKRESSPTTNENENSNASHYSSSQHKRCSRCHAVVYCSLQCQRHDYTIGKHKPSCIKIGKLWEEKSTIEQQLWSTSQMVKKEKSTNPFDDGDDDDDDDDGINIQYPTVGKFWHDHPSSETERLTTRYCVILLQLVQLLGRAESWRVANTTNVDVHRRHQCQTALIVRPTTSISGVCVTKKGRGEGNNENNENIGNPLAREIALDIAFTLLHLDRIDMRIRLLVPSLLLESGYINEAYNYLRHWLSVDTSVAIMDLAMMSELPGMTDDESSSVIDNIIHATTTFSMTSSSSVTANHDLLEPIEHWMDGEMVYTSIGMVFEMAYLKCHLLCSLKRGGGGGGGLLPSNAFDDDLTDRSDSSCTIDDVDCEADIKALTRQVALLLSVVHRWNPHLLPNLADDTYATNTDKGAVVNETAATVNKKDETIHHRAPPPPALVTLLNVHPPGFELQYKMGNPGGGTIDEAVSIWQRDMILWHVVDPMTMEYLRQFCSRLDENLVNTNVLNGAIRVSTTTMRTTTTEKQNNSKGTDIIELKDGMNSTVVSSSDDVLSIAIKRKEAEELVRKLQEEKPERTMGQIMMHPEMATLMIKHLQTNFESSFEL